MYLNFTKIISFNKWRKQFLSYYSEVRNASHLLILFIQMQSAPFLIELISHTRARIL